MTDRELMHQALEALGHTIRTTYADARFDAVLVNNAITALRERLAQPEPAPGYCQHCKQYTIEEPLPAQPEQEPVAWLYRDYYNTLKLAQTEPPPPLAFPVYTTPPRREWVGLMDDDLKPVCDDYRILFGGWVHDFARAIEAKLKEKNA